MTSEDDVAASARRDGDEVDAAVTATKTTPQQQASPRTPLQRLREKMGWGQGDDEVVVEKAASVGGSSGELSSPISRRERVTQDLVEQEGKAKGKSEKARSGIGLDSSVGGVTQGQMAGKGKNYREETVPVEENRQFSMTVKGRSSQKKRGGETVEASTAEKYHPETVGVGSTEEPIPIVMQATRMAACEKGEDEIISASTDTVRASDDVVHRQEDLIDEEAPASDVVPDEPGPGAFRIQPSSPWGDPDHDTYDPTTPAEARNAYMPEAFEVSAQLVQDDDDDDAPLAVASEARGFFIDTKSTRVRCLVLLASLVILGVIAGGIYAGTREDDAPEPETITVFAPTPSTSPTIPPTSAPTVLDWFQVGEDIYGLNGNDRFGWSVSLSSDGSTLAASAPSDPTIIEFLQNLGASTSAAGVVSICTDDKTDWKCQQLPPPTRGRNVIGTLVSVSDDGRVLAVGYSRTSSDANGFVQVYQREGDEWNKLGTSIEGSGTEARFGGTYQWFDDDSVVYDYGIHDHVAQPVSSLSLSDDGRTVAVGSPKDTALGLPSVQVFRYNAEYQIWDQLGVTLFGVYATDYFGHSVSLSANGNVLAVGSPRLTNDAVENAGSVAVYEYDESDDIFRQIGDNIEGISLTKYPKYAYLAYFGEATSLSADGTVIASAAPYRNSDDICEGFVKVHKYSKSKDEWEQYGQFIWQNGGYKNATNCAEIESREVNDSGYAVSLSGDGSRLAVGISSSHRGGHYASGEVLMFDYDYGQDTWLRLGSVIVGNDEESYEGWALSLSSDGSRVAVGAPLSKDDGGIEKGRTRVFEFGGVSGKEPQEQVQCRETELKLELFLTTDVLEGAKSWRVLDRNNSVALRGGPYLDGIVQTYYEVHCIAFQDCYKFTIFDSFGEGIISRGGYSLLVDGNEVAAGGPFGYRNDTFIGNCVGQDLEALFPTFCSDVYEPERVGDNICDKEFNRESCGFDGGDCTEYNRLYPNCKADNPSTVGDGKCDGEDNIESCLWDGGDCEEFNALYPECNVEPEYVGDGQCDLEANNEQCLFDGGDCELFNRDYPNCKVDNPSEVGDRSCDKDANTPECGWDAGDCAVYNGLPECDVEFPSHIADGECDGGEYNTEECGHDGGDCAGFNKKYPNCTVDYPSYVGDGACDGGEYNTEECAYDGGDCDVFNKEYPECTVDDPSSIGDGECDGGEYDTEECGYDGGDCGAFNEEYPECTVDDPSYVGDGDCEGGDYNTKECGYDGGDCDSFNEEYPSCTVDDPSYVGDGDCDGDDYNTEECEYDGGDCL